MVFLRSIFVCFTTWVLTALLNALMAGTWLAFLPAEHIAWPEAFLVCFCCTLAFSIPGLFVFWLVLLVNSSEPLLFLMMLRTMLFVSAISSSLLYVFPLDELKGQHIFLSLLVVVASVTSTMMHHSNIQKFQQASNR